MKILHLKLLVKGNRVTKIKLTIKKSEEKESDSSED